MRWWIVAVALVARLVPVAVLPAYPLQDDTRMYLGIAENVVDGWGFAYDNDRDGIPEVTNKEPGYPSFLAALMVFAGDDAVVFARGLQIVLASLAALLVFDLGTQLVSRRAGLVAATAYALHPGLVLEAGVPGHEGALVPLLLLAIGLTVRFVIRHSLYSAVGAGLVLGAMLLVKQIVLGLPFVAAVAMFAATRGRRRWIGTAALLVGFALAIGPWTVRTLVVRSVAARFIAEASPALDRTSPVEMRRIGRQLTEQGLRERAHLKTLETTTLARVAYEFYASDPRRPLAVVVAGGGEVEGLMARPWTIVRRVMTAAADPWVIASVFLIPYEHRYVEFLDPEAPRLKDWASAGAGEIRMSVLVKALLISLMAVVHVTALAGAAVLVRRPAAWPVLGAAAYFYVAPLVNSAPQNRFFFPGIALVVVVAGLATVLPRRRPEPRYDPRAARVVYVLPAWDARSGEHYAHAIPFLEEVGRRVDLAVVVERASTPPPVTTAARVETLPAGWPPAARMLALAWRLVGLRRRGYARVFVRISLPAALVAGTVGRLLGMRSYYWNSGQGKNIAPPWGPGVATAWRRLRYEAGLVPFYLATRLVHRFVTGPECMRPYYARAYGIAERRTVVLYNDLDVDAFQRRLAGEDRGAARRAMGIPESALVVLFVGRVSPLKGGAYLLPLAEKILGKRDDALVVVVGEVHLADFDRQWREHPHRARVRLMGAMANTDVTRAYAAADVFVLPSNSEGFPRVLLECMAAGLPFAAFDAGGVRQIADPAHAPFIVPRGDVDALARAVVELLDDPGRRLELGRRGRSRVRRYATAEVAAMFVARIVCDVDEGRAST